ncbi:nuclear transport factor 2 family protein [Kitasatospora sp. NPDC088134]|uniref:nuclear transport factor 2 family protein n=1 Tax=Kitasatospora sp. NPDC088134 TaxID=3364071 RepID=UPI00380D45AE
MIPQEKLTDPTVRAFVTAVNSGDRAAFEALLAPGATMADDGSARDLADWTDREIWSSHGRMSVTRESAAGRALTVDYRNDTYGEMRTAWRFDLAADGRITHFETGQA